MNTHSPHYGLLPLDNRINYYVLYYITDLLLLLLLNTYFELIIMRVSGLAQNGHGLTK